MDKEWWKSAACRDVDTDLFYNPSTVASALRCCYSCPVIEECGHAASMEEREYGSAVYGVRNGETAPQRLLRRGYRIRTGAANGKGNPRPYPVTGEDSPGVA